MGYSSYIYIFFRYLVFSGGPAFQLSHLGKAVSDPCRDFLRTLIRVELSGNCGLFRANWHTYQASSNPDWTFACSPAFASHRTGINGYCPLILTSSISPPLPIAACVSSVGAGRSVYTRIPMSKNLANRWSHLAGLSCRSCHRWELDGAFTLGFQSPRTSQTAGLT